MIVNNTVTIFCLRFRLLINAVSRFYGYPFKLLKLLGDTLACFDVQLCILTGMSNDGVERLNGMWGCGGVGTH